MMMQPFLSTLPVRGATRSTLWACMTCQFLSTLPVRGATLLFGDGLRLPPISIHAPREGSDRVALEAVPAIWVFLSTLPVRGATEYVGYVTESWEFLSTLPVRGATFGTTTGTPLG